MSKVKSPSELEIQAVWERERLFHDGWAERGSRPSSAFFLAPCAPENRFLVQALGPLSGKSVLDLGTGLGDASRYFAEQGAFVVAFDLSAEMLKRLSQHAGELAERMHCVQGYAEHLPFSDACFDIVYAANLLHHAELQKTLREVRRVLRDDGVFVTFDPLKYNPVINVYRRLAHQVRTVDERPLGSADVLEIRKLFPVLQIRFFWLASLAVFLKFYFFDRVHPSQERYWRKILIEHDTFKKMYAVTSRIDRVLCRLPLVRWLSWNIALVARPAAPRSGNRVASTLTGALTATRTPTEFESNFQAADTGRNLIHSSPELLKSLQRLTSDGQLRYSSGDLVTGSIQLVLLCPESATAYLRIDGVLLLRPSQAVFLRQYPSALILLA